VITNREEGKGKPPRLFPKIGYPLGYPEPALQQKTEKRKRDRLPETNKIVLIYLNTQFLYTWAKFSAVTQFAVGTLTIVSGNN